MENIQTLLAAVAQTHGFDDDPVAASPPPVKVENSEPRPARVPPIEDVSGNVQPSAAVDVPPIGAISAVGQVSAAGMKRKRGRPPKGQQTAAAAVVVKPPSPKREKLEDEEEDVCFICFDGGSLVLCDRKGCPKAYHPSCIKRDEAFFQSKAKWNCGWHICTVCLKASHYMCYTCPFSLCKRCVKNTDYLCTKNTDYLCVRGTKGFCGTCLKMVMLIENKEQANNEQVKVDFDDKTSWEYLFKVYWVLLKEKLSLTLSEITRARPPLKVEPDDIDCKPQLNNSFSATAVNGNTSISLMKTEHLELSTPCVETSLLQNGRLRTAPSSVCSHVGGGPSHYHDITMPNMDKVNNETGIEKDEQKLGGIAKWASKNVLEFVAFMRNGDTSPMSPSGVQTLLLEYIKRNNLRDPQQKSQILCDQRLKNLFGKPLVGHIEMLTLLEFQFPTKEDSVNNSLTPADVKVNSLPSPPVNSRKRKTRKGNEEIASQKEIIVPQNHLHEYAAIDVHNVSLIYLRRNLVENLLEDPDFNIKVVGSIVRIRSSSQDPKQDIYRLVQVVGTMRVAKPYKVGKRTANSKLEVLNLDEKEVVSIDTISDQNFTEDECRWFRKSIRCGLLKPLTIGEVQKVAMALQPVRVNDWLETEMSRLNNLRGQASKNGQKKEIKEYADRLELLKSSEERQRRIAEVPEIHTDPKMSPSYESEEDTKSGYTHKKVEPVRPSHSFRQTRRKPISRNKRGKKDQPTPSQDRMVPKTEAIGTHGLGPVNQANGTCGSGSVNQANGTYGSGSVNQSNGTHGLGSVNQANGTHGSSKPMNQVNVSNSEIGGLEKRGLEDERAVQKPRLENEQAVQKPRLENEQAVQKPELENEQAVQKPRLENEQAVQKPRLENEQAVQKPELENEQAAQKPALVNEQAIQKPHLESERAIQMPGLENEQVIQKPALENPPAAQKTELKNEGAVQKPRLETSTTPASVENSSSANNDIETEKLWHYRDPNGKIQGPFSMMELRIWDTTGLFPPDIRIWTNHEQYDSLPLTEALIGHLHEGSESSCKHSSGSQENGTPGGIGESEAMNDGSEPMEAAPVNNVPENKSGLMKENPMDSSTWPQCWDLLNNKNSSTDAVQANSSLPLSSCEKAEVVPLPTQCVKPEEREEVEKKNSEPTQDKTSSGNEHQNQCSNVDQPGEENLRPLKIDLSTNVVSLETESAVTAPVSNSLDLNKQIGNTENVDLATENGILELLSPAPRPNNDDTTDASKQSGVLNFPVMDGAGPSWNDIGNEWCGYNSTPVKSSLPEWDSALVSAPVMKTGITSEYANAPISDCHQISQAATALPGPHATSWLAMLNEAIIFDALGEDSISDLLAEVDARESQVALHSPTSAIKFAREFLEDCKDECFSSIEDFNPNLNQNQNLTSDPQKCDGSGSTGEMQLTGQSSCNPIEAFDALDSLRKSSVHSSGSSEGETNAQFYSGDAGSEFHPSATNNPTGQEMVGHPNMTETGSGSDPVDPGWGSVQGNINLVTVQGNVNLVLGPNQGMTNLPWGTNPGTGWVNNVPSINQSPRNGSLPWDGQQRKYVGERYTSPRACYQGNEPGFTRGRPPRGRQPYSSGSSGGFSRGRGQRVCKFYESGHCKKGAFCDYLHP